MSSSAAGRRHLRAGLAAPKDQQVLGIAPRAGGQMVQLEKELQVRRIALPGFRNIQHLQLPVHH
jgi:hypothetical protein